MNKKTLEFVTYVISKLSEFLKMPQGEVFRRLYKSGILYNYIVPSYDVLHTFGSRCINIKDTYYYQLFFKEEK